MSSQMRLRSERARVEGSPAAVNRFLYSRGMTDGLPVVPPTEGRVRAFVEFTRRGPNEVMASVPPAYGAATVEKIAVNAVMAGCEREYMPVPLAAVRAMAEPEFNLNGVQCTTNPVGPMLIINGPIRRDLALNCASGLMGPGRQANATIGRAIHLVLLNVGGAAPGSVDKATQGYPREIHPVFWRKRGGEPVGATARGARLQAG